MKKSLIDKFNQRMQQEGKLLKEAPQGMQVIFRNKLSKRTTTQKSTPQIKTKKSSK